MSRHLASARLAFASALLFVAAAHADTPAVVDAWVAETPPGAPVAAGYLELHNLTDEPLVVTAAMSERFPNVEIHRTEMVDGVARMRAAERLEVAPGARLVFEPGGLHLMIQLPDGASPRAGERIPLVLESSLGPIAFTAPVLSADEAPIEGSTHGSTNHDMHDDRANEPSREDKAGGMHGDAHQ